MTSLDIARDTGTALVDAGGRFMTREEMSVQAKPFGMPAGGLYFRGRAGALGDVSATVATSLIGIFPSWVIELTWRDSAALPAHVAVAAYIRANAQWGRAHLAALSGAERLAELGANASWPPPTPPRCRCSRHGGNRHARTTRRPGPHSP